MESKVYRQIALTKPSANESEIHPPHKTSFYAPGYFVLPEADAGNGDIVRKQTAYAVYSQWQLNAAEKGRGACRKKFICSNVKIA